MKRVFSILLVFVFLLLVSIAGVLIFIDPNDFKPLLTAEVKKATGRDLIIDGDIHWQFWPHVGLSVEKLRLKNPIGFAGSDMLRIARVDMSVAVWPLVSEQLDIGVIHFHGAHIFIQTLPDGVSNVDGLFDVPEKKATSSSSASLDTAFDPSVTPESSSGAPTQGTYVSDKNEGNPWTLSLEGFELTDASITLRDDKSNTISQITALNVNIGPLKTDIWVPIQFDVTGQQNESLFLAKGNLEVFLAKEHMRSQLRNLTLTGTFNSQKLKLEDVSLHLSQFMLAESGNLEFSAKGKTEAMSFETQGQMSLLVDDTLNLINLNDIDMQAFLSGKPLPKEKMEVGFKGEGEWNRLKNIVVLSKIAAHADELTLNGLVSVALRDIPAIRFDLRSPKLDLDAFFSPQVSSDKTAQATSNDPNEEALTPAKKENKTASVKDETKKTPKEKKVLSLVEPDLSALNTLDIAGKIAIESFIASNVEMSQIKTHFLVNRGKINVSQFVAHLYDGTLDIKAVLDAREHPAQYQILNQVKNVSIQPLLMALMDKNLLSGKGSMDINVSGKGLSEQRLRSALKGTVDIHFADGAIEGVNISEMIRKAKARLKGKGDDYVSKSRSTDFSALTATIDIANGVASTKNVNIEAPGLRMTSEGETSLINETLDFNLLVSVVGSSKGQGGKNIDELKDMTIPISVKGAWEAPQYQLDIKALLSDNKQLEIKARKEVKRGLDKLLGEGSENDKVKDKVNNFLNRFFK